MTPHPAMRPGAATGCCDAIRKKFREVFGRECTLPDNCLLTKYAVTTTGDLILILR